MALRFLHRNPAGDTTLATDVCVVGAGIAGLIAATRLARDRHLHVVMVESGLVDLDETISGLNEIDNPADNYKGAVHYRFRGLGGTSRIWSGKLLPVTRSETRARPYIDQDGWPFDAAELEPYRAEIEALMGVDHSSYEEDACAALDRDSLLPRRDADFAIRWPKRPTLENHNLAHIFRHEIRRLDNLEIWLGATVTGFKCDPASGRVTTLHATNHAGRKLHVRAHEYLIAAGGLESTRLLLLADRDSRQAISRDGDTLGRYFNDHLGGGVATLRPLDAEKTMRTLADRFPAGTFRHLHFELRPEVQKVNGIGSAYFDIGIGELQADLTPVKKIKRLVKAVAKTALSKTHGALGREVSAQVKAAKWEKQHQLTYWPRLDNLEIKLWVEQLPNWANRISLSEPLDALQVPKLKLEWTRTAADERTFRVMIEKIGRYWQDHFAGICALDWNPLIGHPGDRLSDLGFDTAHPAGGTRMGTSSANSVVGANLTVHRIPNLSVASSSVFTVSGVANPTLTIMQLAMRAADVIGRRLS